MLGTEEKTSFVELPVCIEGFKPHVSSGKGLQRTTRTDEQRSPEWRTKCYGEMLSLWSCDRQDDDLCSERLNTEQKANMDQ